MIKTLGISPKVILPLFGHLIVAIALLASGHQDLAWQYAAASLPINGILGYLAHAGIVMPVDIPVDEGEASATFTDEQAAAIARQLALSNTPAAQ